MENNEQVLFRKKMGGYNKDDVNRFISEENIKFTEAEADYKRRISILTEENEKLKNALNSSESLVEKLKAELCDCKANGTKQQLEEALYENDLQKTRIEDTDLLLSEKDRLIDGFRDALNTLCDQNSLLREQLASMSLCVDLKAEAPFTAIEKPTAIIPDTETHSFTDEINDEINTNDDIYDSVRIEVNDILECARTEAERIITEARKAASQARSTHVADSDKIKNDLRRRSVSIIDGFKTRITKKK